ncbi:MAG: DUF1549 and DUF1553 domain-containing protein [Bryobacteraceae bacterium]|nr:DUF1549 and DUF1553 domain-containing protein [Bryobacteraceae bacterium]
MQALALSFAMFAADSPTFVRDVLPVMNKVGCTSGPCHGGAKGKGGFKLSLRGYDAEYDYRAILHDLSGRRFNRTEPENSLVLLKPTMKIAHGGGKKIEPDSAYYRTILDWLAAGAPFGDAEASAVTKLEIEPAEVFAKQPGAKQALKIVAHYKDGGTRDVTREAHYTSTYEPAAAVTELGEVSTQRKGETSLLVRYEGRLGVVPVTVLSGKPGFTWNNAPAWNYIDEFVNAKLRRVEIQPSNLSTDEEFLRRVSLDLIGLPPTPEEIRAFLADKREAKLKRTALIDKLMARPEFLSHWAVKWGDLLQVNRIKLGDKGIWAFREWIKESLSENKPYDRMVRELVTAKGSTFQNPPANFLRFTRDPKVAMETSTQLFLGVRMVCAQCHDHPFEQWTQNQYYNLSAFFSTVGIKSGIDNDEEVIYDKRDESEIEIRHPKDNRVMPAKFLFSLPAHKFEEKISQPESDLRETLAAWLTAKDNPYFAKAMANRMWSYFFGRGIIDPVDDIRASNPPTNAPLLDALTADFVKSNYDLRKLIRTIVASRTYQLSFDPNPWNADDEFNFSRAYPRRLTAEQLYDAVHIAAGAKPKIKELPEGSLAQDFPDTNIDRGGFLDLFGRPERQTSCECERRSDVSLVQALNLLNGGTIADAIADADGRIAKLILAGADDRKLVEELYLGALSRRPTPQEIDFAQTYLRKGGSRAERAQDLLWALMNSNAFLFNR